MKTTTTTTAEQLSKTITTAKKTVKSILLRVKLAGYGIVNYDCNDQKWLLGNTRLQKNTLHRNTNFAKKNIYENPDGGMDIIKIKISSDCVKHSIFEKEIPFQSPNISHEENILYSFMGSPAYVLRGGFFEAGKLAAAYKRKAPFQLSDAQQTCGAISIIEMFSKSGMKRTDNTNDDKPDNTLFKKETVGDIEYIAKGSVDIAQLQFMSTDIIFDRASFSDEKFDKFSKFLKVRMESFNSELGYYKKVNSVNEIPEHGFKFTNEDVVFLVKHLFKSILELHIGRKGSYAITDDFQYKLVYTPTEDTLYNENGWVSVKTLSDIENVNFTMEDFYVINNKEESLALRETLIENSITQDKKSAEIKQKQNDDKKKSKEKKEKKSKKEESALTEAN